jgi:hypothetical protein
LRLLWDDVTATACEWAWRRRKRARHRGGVSRMPHVIHRLWPKWQSTMTYDDDRRFTWESCPLRMRIHSRLFLIHGADVPDRCSFCPSLPRHARTARCYVIYTHGGKHCVGSNRQARKSLMQSSGCLYCIAGHATH